MLRYAKDEGLKEILREVDLIQRWQHSGIKKKDLLTVWGFRKGISEEEFSVLAELINNYRYDPVSLYSALNYNMNDIKKLSSNEWLYLASCSIKGAGVLRELLYHPVPLHEIKKHIKDNYGFRTLLIREGIYAFICNQKEEIKEEIDDRLFIKSLIKHRSYRIGNIPVKLLANILKEPVMVSELITA